METNPYSSPEADQHRTTSRDDRLFRRMIAAFKQWRARTPTFGNLLFSRRSAVFIGLLVIVGAASIFYFSLIGAPPEWPYFTVGMIVGVVIFYFASIRRTVASWPIHESLMDWEKIEAHARELGL